VSPPKGVQCLYMSACIEQHRSRSARSGRQFSADRVNKLLLVKPFVQKIEGVGGDQWSGIVALSEWQRMAVRAAATQALLW